MTIGILLNITLLGILKLNSLTVSVRKCRKKLYPKFSEGS
jgi:hypothetical protein